MYCSARGTPSWARWKGEAWCGAPASCTLERPCRLEWERICLRVTICSDSVSAVAGAASFEQICTDLDGGKSSETLPRGGLRLATRRLRSLLPSRNCTLCPLIHFVQCGSRDSPDAEGLHLILAQCSSRGLGFQQFVGMFQHLRCIFVLFFLGQHCTSRRISARQSLQLIQSCLLLSTLRCKVSDGQAWSAAMSCQRYHGGQRAFKAAEFNALKTRKC